MKLVKATEKKGCERASKGEAGETKKKTNRDPRLFPPFAAAAFLSNPIPFPSNFPAWGCRVPFLFLALLFLCVGRLLLCSTSPPGGNQVDGSPPARHAELAGSNRLELKNVQPGQQMIIDPKMKDLEILIF